MLHEKLFYETMHRARYTPYPLPWWVHQYFKNWSDEYDTGLFNSKEGAFASNAHYRYWSMVGVKDHHQESLVGQAGEIEPVYDKYAVSFFLFGPNTRQLYFPQNESGAYLNQYFEDGHLPIIHTAFTPPIGCSIHQAIHASTTEPSQRSVVFTEYEVSRDQGNTTPFWLGVAISPVGPSGFQRHDKAGRYNAEMGITLLEYNSTEHRVTKLNTNWGPVFDIAPTTYGLYGNTGSEADDFYVQHNPYKDLSTSGNLNQQNSVTDHKGGMCSAVFCWEIPTNQTSFKLGLKLPVDDFRGASDLQEINNASAQNITQRNKNFWQNKLNHDGLQFTVPTKVKHLEDSFKISRANLLILSDHGQIHPGPTIYDSFWVRDSSVEGIACALVGDTNLPIKQFGQHYRTVFNMDPHEYKDDIPLYGFFGGEHEINDREWDSNGQALWAICKLDRILGSTERFAEGLYTPYLLEGARWLFRNRSPFGLLHHGWSAEHLGSKDKPHYWDDLWALAGLFETAKMAERYGKFEVGELWYIYNDLRVAMIDSIRWVLTVQRQQGHWETFIPTGPANVGELNSEIIGALAYFHPCKLYDGKKLGDDIDNAFRHSLYTIWGHFINGGFKHDSAWQCFGPYLTLQLAHAFLYIGDIEKMDQLLGWTIWAGNAPVSGTSGQPNDTVNAAMQAWNEQHCYPIADDFSSQPFFRRWYMGDIPHGWACAELLMLMRDILFFEVDEDANPHIYIAPGIMPHWLESGEKVTVSHANTTFGKPFGFELEHKSIQNQIEIKVTSSIADVGYIYPFRLNTLVSEIVVDGNIINLQQGDIYLPARFKEAIIKYQ